MTLPDGTTVRSVLLPGESPPRHVYRIVDHSGAVLRDVATLAQVSTYLRSERRY